MLYIGLMSGTSADGIDGALVDLADNGFQILATHSQDYSPGIQDAIEDAIRRYRDIDAEKIRHLHEALGADFARAGAALAERAAPGETIAAIGSHGQTVYHGPDDSPPRSVQLGDAQIIADRSGIPTVADFRHADLAAGGQGAPLAPAFHNAMFRATGVDRVIVNIGGIANITRLPGRRDAPVLGFDTGPGNTVMDQWCRLQTGQAYDRDGAWARSGRVPEALVEALLADPWFDLAPPKSTGREYFHLDWMKRRYPDWQTLPAADVQAALLETTARSICRAAWPHGSGAGELYVCGGGARNPALMARLTALAPGVVSSTETLGVAPEWVEACAFAWLAYRRLHERPGNLPSVTGARRAVLLGRIHQPAD